MVFFVVYFREVIYNLAIGPPGRSGPICMRVALDVNVSAKATYRTNIMKVMTRNLDTFITAKENPVPGHVIRGFPPFGAVQRQITYTVLTGFLDSSAQE